MNFIFPFSFCVMKPMCPTIQPVVSVPVKRIGSPFLLLSIGIEVPAFAKSFEIPGTAILKCLKT